MKCFLPSLFTDRFLWSKLQLTANLVDCTGIDQCRIERVLHKIELKFNILYQTLVMRSLYRQQIQNKTFVFENQLTYKSVTLQHSVNEYEKYVDLSLILKNFSDFIQVQQKLLFQIYDPQLNKYVKLDIMSKVEQRFFCSSVIMLKYKEETAESDTQSLQSLVSSQTKKQRNKQRTIREVIDCVKRWREIHNTLDEYKNKITLMEAAKIVGISKKSLDDYFCQLRLGELYEFDFAANLDEKVGILRAYVKKNRPKGQKQLRNERHPKRLKVIEEMADQMNTLKIEQSQQIQKAEEEKQPNQVYESYGIEFTPIQIQEQNEYENQFYNSFDFMLNEPADPFIPFNPMDYRDFRKKDPEFNEFDLEYNNLPW